MVAADLLSPNEELDESNVFAVDKDLKLLKSGAIYGANASGKSNLVKALDFMKWFMVNSSKETQIKDKISIEPFRLSTETEKEPSFFEIVFLLDQQRYRYGFEVNRDRVVSEWLFYVPSKRETKLFERSLDEFKIIKKYGAKGIKEITRDNALFLSVSAQFNVEIATKIIGWITEQLNVIPELSESDLYQLKMSTFDDSQNLGKWKAILDLIKNLDLGIEDVVTDQFPIAIGEDGSITFDIEESKIINNSVIHSSGGQGKIIQTKHRKFDGEGNYVEDEIFSLEHNESQGTQKVFALAGMLIDTVKNSQVLVIDELDSKLHPLISLTIIGLFNSKYLNPHNAQLVFTTHDTFLLDKDLFRRDQVWFTEKDKYSATDLYSLVEYEDSRNSDDVSYKNEYTNGRYGAIPFLEDLMFENDGEKEKL